MIKKHQKFPIYGWDLPKNFFGAATKENPQTYQRKPKHWRKPASFIDKDVNVQLLVQSDGETYCSW